ncbi:uncharacterized protein LOC125851905, partial [Solanum stenotomum]|uniref:uncharacterized protein LOC125851905 n=1 Tax=Solanum stenotomum TaxID=172797 RepID=UPI0020D13A42
MEVQKATLAMKIEMTEKICEAKIEMEEMDKKFLEAKEEAKEDKKAMERKLSEAKRDMEEIIADKVKKGIQAYIESLGINLDANLKSKQVPDNSLEDCQQSLSHVPVVQTKKVPDNSFDDCQQSLSPIPVVHTKKANMIKKIQTSIVGKNKNKWVSLKKTTNHQTSFLLGIADQLSPGELMQQPYAVAAQLLNGMITINRVWYTREDQVSPVTFQLSKDQ